MSVSVGKIVTQVNSKIVSGGQNAINTARLVGSVEAIEERYSVANLAALPSAANNTGRFIYVVDIAAYRYSDGARWTNDYDTATVTNGQLWAWGLNSCGILGDGTNVSKCSPVREISSSTDWCGVSGGSFHIAAIKTSGQLWTWGSNACGQLGDGTTVPRCSPVREISSATDWCQMSAGGLLSAAIKTTGQLWTWGGNLCGALGDGTVTNRCSPVREFCSATDWCQVSMGCVLHTAAIKTTGQIWGWGLNTCGRLGDGTTVGRCSPVRERCSATDWCGVSAGDNHTAAVKTTGQIWAWGFNTCGLLGDGTTVDRCSPVRERCSATDWCRVSAGCCHTAAVKTSGQIWAWGTNVFGRLGDGTGNSRCSPVREFCSGTDWCGVSAGGYHTSAIKTTGQIWGWGVNLCGRLGNGATVESCSPVREISSTTDWCQVSAGLSHTVAVKIIKGFNEP